MYREVATHTASRSVALCETFVAAAASVIVGQECGPWNGH